MIEELIWDACTTGVNIINWQRLLIDIEGLNEPDALDSRLKTIVFYWNANGLLLNFPGQEERWVKKCNRWNKKMVNNQIVTDMRDLIITPKPQNYEKRKEKRLDSLRFPRDR